MRFVHVLNLVLGLTTQIWPVFSSLHVADDAVYVPPHLRLPGVFSSQGGFESYRFNVSDVAKVDPPSMVIRPLVVSGNATNRVDLVFFSDGYTASEAEKFFADAQRLADDVSGNHTFNTVKPMLNFWGAFTPSVESGIGIGGKPKNTVYGLYRDGTQLRGVYYSKPEVATAACQSLGTQCDYPILLANDPYYGGLGGTFTVITSSSYNGPLVLRHELGHSIIGVGEEYDGGYAYFGVNYAPSTSVGWSHWLTDAPSVGVAPRVERTVMPYMNYTWTMMTSAASWKATFSSAGTYSWFLVRISLSGLPLKSDATVLLDGTDLGWQPQNGIGLDRYIYDIKSPAGWKLGPGRHNIEVKLNNAAREGSAQVCSVEVLEFGNENEFVAQPGYYGLYPTFSDANKTTYRPTNEECLMRMVTTPNFCKVCMEGLWLALLSRVKLIESFTNKCEGTGHRFDLQLVPFAQWRGNPIPEEKYLIEWTRNGTILPQFANQVNIKVPFSEEIGTYSAKVELKTPEVKVDTKRRLSDSRTVQIIKNCG